MSNVNKTLLILTVLLVLVIGVILYSQKSDSPDNNFYAVMTESGELFFGELQYGRGAYLTNVWTLQRTDDEKNPFSLVKFDQSIWGPEDKLELNEKGIVWKTKLRADSQVLAQIKNPAPLVPQAPQAPTQ